MKLQNVKIEKLAPGGQGLGTLESGKNVFVWNALPGEEVIARVFRNKSSYAEAIAEEILVPSTDRTKPLEENYLSTSPWQIMTFAAENIYKKQLLTDIFSRVSYDLPEFTLLAPPHEWNYRNKMEYSFWGDDTGLHLALHRRGSHGKQIVTGSKLAMPAIDAAAQEVLSMLQKMNIRAGDLKTVVVRASQRGRVAASLFTKRSDMPLLTLPKGLSGLRVYYSNPKSPASIPTELLQDHGDVELSDVLLGKEFYYNADSFFQVNVSMFEKALSTIKAYCQVGEVIDMYGGVGTIGLSVSKQPVIIELDDATVAMARKNATGSKARVVQASTEKALEHIVSNKALIVDPPRAGLHKKVIQRIMEAKPKQVIYLSCNPVTQARDVAILKEEYNLTCFEGYNFFPRTPHIESLVILQRKQQP